MPIWFSKLAIKKIFYTFDNKYTEKKDQNPLRMCTFVALYKALGVVWF